MKTERPGFVPTLKVLRDLRRPVFTTREFASVRGASLSSAAQSLRRLARSGQLQRLSRGLWCDPSDSRFSVFSIVPLLTPGHRAYVSFLTALHLHGIIEQIPQVVQVATTGHGRRVATPAGVFELHRIDPRFFAGFDWYGSRQEFLVASPEKALVDCLYLSTRRGKRFGSFPELSFPRGFSARRARGWARSIPDPRIRAAVLDRLEAIL
jgi:predicted transcriptional regulator of viral defense system